MAVTVANRIASGSFVSFSSNLSATVIYTDAGSGSFVRLNLYQEAATTSFAVPSISWTDDTGNARTLGLSWSLSTGVVNPLCIVLRVGPSQAISIETTGGRSTDTTSIYYAIEQL